MKWNEWLCSPKNPRGENSEGRRVNEVNQAQWAVVKWSDVKCVSILESGMNDLRTRIFKTAKFQEAKFRERNFRRLKWNGSRSNENQNERKRSEVNDWFSWRKFQDRVKPGERKSVVLYIHKIAKRQFFTTNCFYNNVYFIERRNNVNNHEFKIKTFIRKPEN